MDVSVFEARADDALKTGTRDRLEAALAVYQADLLPEDLYEDWSVLRREQLRSKKEQLLLRLADVCEAAAENGAAIQVYQETVGLNPYNESAHRGLMRLYAAEGQRHLAIQQFRSYSDSLAGELGVKPEPETFVLYEQILAGSVEKRQSPAVETPPPGPMPVVTDNRRNLRWYVTAAVLLLCAAAGVLVRYKIIAPPLRSVAIMPLVAGTNAGDLEYLADGITESVIGELSQLPGLTVMARSTVYRYRARGTDPMVAAAEMKVDAVLTGTIARTGSNLLLSAELVGVPDGSRLWGNRYTLTARELISVQDRISSEIAEGLRLRLSGPDRASLSPSHPTDPEAYRLYVQARYFWNQRSREGYLRSIELYQSAIARDPGYARAYAGLSDSYSFLGRDEAPTSQYMPKARAAAEKALSIDPKLAEAHASLGMMSNVYEWRFPTAEEEFQKALALDPNYSTTRLFYGVFLASQGRVPEAQIQLDQAAKLDPLSPIIALCRGYPAAFSGQIEPAIRAAKESLEIAPGFESGLEDLMTYLERQGKQEPAMLNAIALLHARQQHELAERVQSAYRKAGYQAAIRVWFESEEKRAAESYVSPLRIGILAMRAGDLDKAFLWMNKAVDERNAGVVYLGIDPKYDRLRSDPRFPPLCARVGVTRRR